MLKNEQVRANTLTAIYASGKAGDHIYTPPENGLSWKKSENSFNFGTQFIPRETTDIHHIKEMMLEMSARLVRL